MKIGILTYHNVANFGANLQLLSTVNYLKQSGYVPLVINWYLDELEEMYKRLTPQIQLEMHKSYRDKNLPISKMCKKSQDIADIIEDENIEGLIIGSDAVAQHHPLISRIVFRSKKIVAVKKVTPDIMYSNLFWGNFVPLLRKKIPMAMMSVSSQDSAYRLINKSLRSRMFQSISNFNFISVRDDWTQKMFKFISDGKIIPSITPDPVFAFNHNVTAEQLTKKFILNKFNLRDDYILLSFRNSKAVNNEWVNNFELLAKKKGYDCAALPFPQGILFSNNLKKQINLPLDPLEWYALIKYSKGYIGHNMHPIVISLHNAVPFFCFDNWGTVKFNYIVNEKTSKTYHLLSEAGFLDYRITNIGRLQKIPTPQFVFDKIMSFDTVKAQNFSQLYFKNYTIMMKNILSIMR
ncbi:MAG: polysaccharide pyruvyl transferase family protein [Chitinispirillaceae bacterium]|nr:polysaccharide pyruvyl transferase family protein [Chitinispirillaceae bacterium]